MVQMNKAIRQPRSTDDVMQEVEERVPHLLEHCFLDRDWIWICGVDLRGEQNRATREALGRNGIGFRFSPGGHTMPDGKTVGHWGHSCSKPSFPKRKAATRGRKDDSDPAAMLRELGL